MPDKEKIVEFKFIYFIIFGHKMSGSMSMKEGYLRKWNNWSSTDQ